MSNQEDILAAAKAAPAKVQLEAYREAVEELRQKGYTWREIADFLTERGVQADHTRVYRTFGQARKDRQKESRPVEVMRVTYLGERLTKKGKTWKLMEIELASRLDKPVTVTGYVWGMGTPAFARGTNETLSCRNAMLVYKSGNSFPTAHIKAEL